MVNLKLYKTRDYISFYCDDCGEYTKKQYRKKGIFETICYSCSKKKSLKEKYGVENVFQLNEVKEKIKQTCLERYGVEHNSQSFLVKERSKQTCLEKYGKEYTFQTENNKEKSKQTCLERYGVEFSTQCYDVRVKIQHKYFYDDVKFDSSWELAYYIWLKDQNIKFVYQPNITYTFLFEEKIHYYRPDFKIGNRIIDLKGLQFFKERNPLNRMVNPYRHEYDDLYEAKHQCMLENNVEIITDCSEQLQYVKNKYGKNFLKNCKK